MRVLQITIDDTPSGAELRAQYLPADCTDPHMQAFYSTLSDAIDQSVWMRNGGNGSARIQTRIYINGELT